MAIPKNKLRIGGIVLLLLVGAVILLLNPLRADEVLAKCQDLYDRGEYTACSRILTKRVAKNPDWHEGRRLLVAAQLADNDPLEALPNYLYLLEANETGGEKNELLKQLAETEEFQQRARELLAAMLDANPDLDKTREFAAEFELKVDNLPGALQHLYLLSANGNPSRYLEGMAARSCSDYSQWEKYMDELLAKDPQRQWPQEMKLVYALEHEEIELMGKVVSELGSLEKISPDILDKTFDFALNKNLVVAMEVAINSKQQPWMEDVLARAEQCSANQLRSQLPGLLNLLPEEIRLQVLSALYLMPPEQGLQQLLALEEQGYLPPDPEKHLEEKVRMLRQAGIFDFKYLKFLDLGNSPLASVMNLAMECWHSNPQGIRLLADQLQELGHPGLDAHILRSIASYSQPLPKLIWQRPGTKTYFTSVSPKGKWLLLSFSTEILAVNLSTGEETVIDDVGGHWHWSPDGKQAASLAGRSESVLLVLTTANGKIHDPREVPLPENYRLLGWMDNNNLAIMSSTNTYTSRVAKINVNTGNVQWLSDYREGWPTLNHAGELVWITPEKGTLHVETAKGTKSFLIYDDASDYVHFDFLSPLDWFPDNKKILFADSHLGLTGSLCHSLDLASGDFDRCGEISRIYSPGNWVDDKNAWDFYFFGIADCHYSPLIKTNFISGEAEFAGLVLPISEMTRYSSSGKVVAVAGDQGVQVYRMP